jgi:hypothetical protein
MKGIELMEIHPFCDGDTFAAFSKLVESIRHEILSLDNEYALKASITELEDHYIDKVRIEPLILHSDEYYIYDQSGTQIDVSHDVMRMVFPGERALVRGTQLEIAIPFEGDPILWRIRASTWSLSGYPVIDIRNSFIILKVVFPDDSADPQRLKSEIDSNVRSLLNALENLRRDVEAHNNSASQTIRSTIEQKINTARSTVGAIVALGIPIRRRDQPLTYTIPAKRRQSPTMPRVKTEPYKPDPVLSEEEYSHILNVMQSMSLVIERNPVAFAHLDEEAIRTHFLLQLNGHYEGAASGETFNASGKTDILIRVENRNIFIAECKFWRGAKYFNEGVDQLLSYLAWRDSKCAVLVFNKTKDTSGVKQKMHELMQARPEYRKTVFHKPDGDSRYAFVKDSDPGKEIMVTTQVYDFAV